MADSTVTIVGTATRDPELRYTAGGRGVASFGVAVNRRYQKDGEWVDAPASFFDVTAWGTLGENCAASLKKGMRVVVYGRLEQRSWDTQEGEKRTKIEVIADEIGPSLRWAQAQVEKTARETATRPDDGYEQTGRQSSGQGGGGVNYDDNAEPFIRHTVETDLMPTSRVLTYPYRPSPLT